jgi:hypothetical protein
MVEPLDLIGRSQTEPNVELRKLASGLAQILEQNRGRRDVAGIQGATARDVAAFGRGFPGASALMGAGPELAKRRISGDFARNAPATLAGVQAGVFGKPPPGATMGEAVGPGVEHELGIPTGVQAAQRTGLDAIKEQLKDVDVRKSKEMFSIDPKTGKRIIIPPVVSVEDVEKRREKTTTKTKKGGGRRFDRLGRPIAAPTPSAAADTGVDVFTATPAELAAQGLVRAKLRHDTKGYKKGDIVVYRQLGDQMGPVVAHRKGKI